MRVCACAHEKHKVNNNNSTSTSTSTSTSIEAHLDELRLPLEFGLVLDGAAALLLLARDALFLALSTPGHMQPATAQRTEATM